MHFLILGGSGRTGRLVIEEALQRGHTITALVRDASSLAAREGLTVTTGTPLSQSDIEDAIKASRDVPSAVIVTLNSLRASDNPFSAPVSPPLMMTDCNVNAMAAMSKFGIRKLVVLQAIGTAASRRNVFWPMRLVMNYSGMRRGMDDHDATDREVRARGALDLDFGFVMVRPVMLVEGEKKPLRFWGDDGDGAGCMPSVTRTSVAGFLLDVAETDERNGSTPVISN
ncbi:hypothetical protein PVAG01_07698 [Phlyctema vagabunda]|uniref:NAD(P)-binding domain-containing protein n=1 Tax=Phlyctema vagabunda TaxID=108571 RepID=A0ABR4PD75_9HELO